MMCWYASCFGYAPGRRQYYSVNRFRGWARRMSHARDGHAAPRAPAPLQRGLPHLWRPRPLQQRPLPRTLCLKTPSSLSMTRTTPTKSPRRTSAQTKGRTLRETKRTKKKKKKEEEVVEEEGWSRRRATWTEWRLRTQWPTRCSSRGQYMLVKIRLESSDV